MNTWTAKANRNFDEIDLRDEVALSPEAKDALRGLRPGTLVFVEFEFSTPTTASRAKIFDELEEQGYVEFLGRDEELLKVYRVTEAGTREAQRIESEERPVGVLRPAEYAGTYAITNVGLSALRSHPSVWDLVVVAARRGWLRKIEAR